MFTHVDPNSRTTTFTYDVPNRVATRQDALTRTESYAYEVGGLNMVTDRKGQVSGLTYDELGRLATRGFGATVAAPTAYTSTVGYNWDNGNRLTPFVDRKRN